ncbi:hypothetical protein [Mycobacteroides abscessus]|uniref:Uncharacterized protein n=1 Tax=Mycobacteroides abscessus subsp. bolletii 50594 TaxID=1303024 RepID=A0AB33AJ00_9MYCO|nr:hypothetical protein [Mycobacteroides abscessus]AGM31723.1 hypothetical protein MASS_2p0012 [Mycobacteroides abscessus subsp. bolletii 50594]MBN7379304.1 hypothetical protein [Mycobacteroides abscessus subsp. massiliense]MBN7468787.1 hypothetical protein [Mycobacteroides abscessus subsp. massiliense]MDO2972737.1 hypothetical protein [Mycobacteroides abscessus subsp. bolletii]MDO3080990.1 hypothetical protein [Mycobacteroides abscessus subsp. bolletii]
MSLAPGASWPGAARGEVVSPSGRRAYLANTVATLCGRSAKWATNLAGTIVESERGRIAGHRGRDTWFLLADSLEHYLQEQGMWPPADQAVAAADGEWEQLIALQGADLEAARREITELNARVAALENTRDDLEAQRNQLLDTISQLTQIAKTPPRASRDDRP